MGRDTKSALENAEDLVNVAHVGSLDRLLGCSNGSIDIFGLFRGDALLGELRVRYTADDDRLAVRGVRAYLYAFRVRPEHQGQGVGKHLLSSVIATLSERGCTEMTVGVEDDNPRARHIYESLGFTEKIARLTESYQGDEYSFDLLLKK